MSAETSCDETFTIVISQFLWKKKNTYKLKFKTRKNTRMNIHKNDLWW